MKILIGLISVLLLCSSLKGERYVIEGNSMLPKIENGDLVYIEHKDFFRVKPGDIILFRASYKGTNMVVCHRVLSRNYIFLYTKGDNNSVGDNFTITRKEFLGKIKN
jgi:signal peptidase I